MINSKLHYISNLRIVCTLLVIFGHSYPFNVHIPSFLINIRTVIYTFHMPLFILISGYLTTFNKSVDKYGSLSYVKNRTIKLVTPYLVLSALFYVPKSFLDSATELSINAFLESIFVPRVNVWGHFWFLPMLIMFTIISVFICKMMSNKKAYVIILCIISYFLIFIPEQTHLFAFNDVKNNLSYYWTGMLLGDIKIGKPIQLNKKVSFTLICLILLIFSLFNVSSGHFNTLIKILIALFMSYGLFLILYNRNLCDIKFFDIINKYSFSLFILSWPYQSVIEIICNKIFHLPVIATMFIMFFGGITLPLLTIILFNYFNNKLSETKLRRILNFTAVSIGLK